MNCLKSSGYASEVLGALGKLTFQCPHHTCKRCGRKAGAAGGLLLRCTECPTAYCDECEPQDETFLSTGECDRFRNLGMPSIKQAYYMQCSQSCRKFRDDRLKYGAEFAIKKSRKTNTSTYSGSSSIRLPSNRPFQAPPFAADYPNCIIDYDSCRWAIAAENDTVYKIAAWSGYNDPTRLVYNNDQIQGLSKSSRLRSGTPFFLDSNGKSPLVDSIENSAIKKKRKKLLKKQSQLPNGIAGESKKTETPLP